MCVQMCKHPFFSESKACVAVLSARDSDLNSVSRPYVNGLGLVMHFDSVLTRTLGIGLIPESTRVPIKIFHDYYCMLIFL